MFNVDKTHCLITLNLILSLNELSISKCLMWREHKFVITTGYYKGEEFYSVPGV
jgi:hypothetical protein